MTDFRFKLNVSIDDRTGATRAAYVGVRDGDAAETREVVPGKVFADYDASGALLGIEFLSPCSATVLDAITEDEPGPVQGYVRNVTPRGLVPA